MLSAPALAQTLAACLLFFQATLVTANEACYHNVVREALNTGKTMTNLGPRLDQTYNFAQQRQPLVPLPYMTANTVLRDSAVSWASRCRFDHSGLPGRGENLFVGTETYLNPAKWTTDRKWRLQNAVNDWAYEARLLTVGEELTSCVGGASQCGHYTQMVWDDTTQVGCAAQFCPSVTQNGRTIFDGRQATLIVCHYSPLGNYVPYIGGPYLAPYVIGREASSSAAPLSGCTENGGDLPPLPEPEIDLGYIMSILQLLLD